MNFIIECWKVWNFWKRFIPQLNLHEIYIEQILQGGFSNTRHSNKAKWLNTNQHKRMRFIHWKYLVPLLNFNFVSWRIYFDSLNQRKRIFIFPKELTDWFTFIFIPWKFASANFDFFCGVKFILIRSKHFLKEFQWFCCLKSALYSLQFIRWIAQNPPIFNVFSSRSMLSAFVLAETHFYVNFSHFFPLFFNGLSLWV